MAVDRPFPFMVRHTSAVDALLSTPPARVSITKDMDGVVLSYRPQATIRNHVMDIIGPLLMMTFPTLGALIGAAVPIGLTIKASAPIVVLGVVLSVLGLLAGFFMGLVPVYHLSTALERLLGISTKVHVTLQEHMISLGGERINISDVLFVDRKALTVVVQGGRRLPVAADAPEDIRRWLCEVLHTVTAAREGGSPEEIPQALAALKQTT